MPASIPIQDGELLAAIDLGSNSFHMVIARYMAGELRVIDRLRETVRIGDGLSLTGELSAEVKERALACMARFGQRVRTMPANRVRAFATNTVRRLRRPQAFLDPAEKALGHSIEVISGREEARLIYLGVAHSLPPKTDQQRLVIDIGGGSTEVIIGRGMVPIERESLQAGCIASTRRFFPDGKLSKKRWKVVLPQIGSEFQQFASKYRRLGWQESIGSSGTHKAIGEICAEMNLSRGTITAEAIPVLREELLKAKHIDDIVLAGLSADRRPIIAGGILILEAAFQALGLSELRVSKAAMREGILYDIVGRGGENDPRQTAIQALVRRYEIDEMQAARVQHTVQRLFEQVANGWSLAEEDSESLLMAAQLHEIGLAIAHSQHHLHGSYILENSDIAGFSREEQLILATLVRVHRRHVPKNAFDALPERLQLATRCKAAVLRLAVALHRSHESDPIPLLRAKAKDNQLQLILDEDWLTSRPLLHADLLQEIEDMKSLGIQFKPFVRE